jgi:hypothetical protein
MEVSMKFNTILTGIALILCLGITPQAQGMAYLKTIRNTTYSLTHSLINSAKSLQNCIASYSYSLLTRAMAKKTETQPVPETVEVKNHENTNQNPSIARARAIVNHLVNTPEKPVDKEIKNEIVERLEGYLQWYLKSTELANLLINSQMYQEEICDGNGQKIATLYSHCIEVKDTKVFLVRLVKNDGQTIGFSVATAKLKEKLGRVNYLLVSQDERKNGFGPTILLYNGRNLYQAGCREIEGTANSLNLKANEDKQVMQQKLEGLYRGLGAHSKSIADTSQMRICL